MSIIPRSGSDDLEALAEPLWAAVELLNGLIGAGGSLVDEIGASNMEETVRAFGSGVSKPDQFDDDPVARAWLERERAVAEDLRVMVDRMVAVGRIAQVRHTRPRSVPTAALRTAAEVLTDFWRGMLRIAL